VPGHLSARARVSGGGGAAAAVNWWEAGGATGCVWAYQPKGAADSTAAKINLANPGTYNAVHLANAPSWNTTTGWTYDGTNDGSYSPYAVTNTNRPVTWLIRFANITNTGGLFGIDPWSGCYFYPDNGTAVNIGAAGADNARSPDMAAGVYGLAGSQPYRNGATDGATIGTPDFTAGEVTLIGSLWTKSSYCAGDIIAVALWIGALSAAQVLAVSTAMAAL
jgi:hypothetical protein